MKIIFTYIILLFSFCFFSVSTVYTAEEKQEPEITISKNKVTIYGDIEIKSFREVAYEFEVFGDLTIGNQVKLRENITVHGDIHGGDYIVSYKTLSAHNIELGNNFSGTDIIASGDVKLYGFAKIHNGFDIAGDLDTGSDLLLLGNSRIGGNMTVGIDSQIYGTLYVYGNVFGKTNLDFFGDKLKIIGNLRALEKSEIYGRLYIDGLVGRRSLYTNNILITYTIENEKYSGLLGRIDPILQYDLSVYQVESILQTIQYLENNLKNQRQIILSSRNINTKLSQIEILKKQESEFIQFVEKYVSTHQKDDHKWRVIKRDRELELSSFLHKISD